VREVDDLHVDLVHGTGHQPEAGTDITLTESTPHPDDQVSGVAGESSPATPLRRILEAVLLVADEPIAASELARASGSVPDAVAAELSAMRTSYLEEQRGFELREVAGGWRFYTSESCAEYVERFVLEGAQARLTHAALETLAVVAYRQPVARQSISAIRGVNVDGVIRTLLARGLIAESGQGAGGATLYETTPLFLDRLGLTSLDELPSLAPYLPDSLDELADEL
jgi:segregation and condensation protein B